MTTPLGQPGLKSSWNALAWIAQFAGVDPASYTGQYLKEMLTK
tara:strand:- start:1411 stop:1539 length:129 start_codon:yes stop_codon:yes gene_type:complete